MISSMDFTAKYRPDTLAKYIGDRVKMRVLSRTSEGSPPQSILAKGTMGSGKTSIVRLIAKEVNCTAKVPYTMGTATYQVACNNCKSCNEIDKYIRTGEVPFSGSIIELDIATDSGKDVMVSELEKAKKRPLGSKYKVLILDEVHMASKAAQSALLKVIEEPPKHLIIALCTTDAQKLLETIPARCSAVYNISHPTERDLMSKLTEIVKEERISITVPALTAIIKISGVNPRKSIKLLEDIAKTYQGEYSEINLERVREHTGKGALDQFFLFMEIAQLNNYGDTVQFLYELTNAGIVKEFIEEFSKFFVGALHCLTGNLTFVATKVELAKIKVMINKGSMELDLILDGLTEIEYKTIIGVSPELLYFKLVRLFTNYTPPKGVIEENKVAKTAFYEKNSPKQAESEVTAKIEIQ
jgi:DNA polymerase III subunit gamma/tau